MIKNLLVFVYQAISIWWKMWRLYRLEKSRFPNLHVFTLACHWVVSEYLQACESDREKRAFVLWSLYALEIAREEAEDRDSVRKELSDRLDQYAEQEDVPYMQVIDILVKRWEEVLEERDDCGGRMPKRLA